MYNTTFIKKTKNEIKEEFNMKIVNKISKNLKKER